MRHLAKKTVQTLFAVAGWVFVVIGVIGIFLPLLPTTPFLLLAAYCFDRSSPKFHQWLLNHKVLGPPIHDWRRGKVIRPRVKVLACAMILFTSYFVYSKPTIPTIGKVAYSIVIFSAMGFILTRKNR